MILRRPTALALLPLLLIPPGLLADPPPTLERVRIGLPAGPGGQDVSCTRNGHWAPVAVTLRAGGEAVAAGAYHLRLESTDLEELSYQIRVPVPEIARDARRTVMGYLVPGSNGARFRVSVESAAGQVASSLQVPPREGRDVIAAPDDILFLAAGSGLEQLRKAAEALDRPQDRNAAEIESPGRRRVAVAEDVAQMPDRWIGYDAADVVVLVTGNEEFVRRLADPAESARREALLEWVRRGGQLVLSVGKNTQAAARLLTRLPVIGCKIEAGEQLAELPVVSTQWSNREIHRPALKKCWVAGIEPGPGVDVLVREGRWPAILQSSYGLGRVVLVAFDLDTPPFTTWDGQQAFWTRLQKEIAPYLQAGGARKQEGGRARPGPGEQVNPLALGDERYDSRAQLKRALEMFEEIPAVSFGWVALFLVFYIVLVGPLDYFILKKFVKRLELTWITFPVLVILVSVAAYLTAYSVKGDDLRINKIDLVDVDLHNPRQVYGQSWFTLFSPRVASYTIGIEPAGGAWTADAAQDGPGRVMSILEAGERPLRAGPQTASRRPYEYAGGGRGMERVPIPVWSSRSFSAAWQAPVGKEPPIGVTDDQGPIRQARDGRGLVGRLTNNLAVPLQDVTLFYRGKWYSAGRLEPGEWKRVETLFAADARGQNRDLLEWIGDARILAPGLPLAPSGRAVNAGFQESRPSYHLMKPLMFFLGSQRAGATNAGLRRFDQSWRLNNVPQYPIQEGLRYRDEVILVARTPMLCDLAGTVDGHGATPSRLWLGKLPEAGADQPELPGVMTQETYLRMFVPVERAGR